eukprot:869448-Prorocentrum_minimum.AAC.3
MYTYCEQFGSQCLSISSRCFSILFSKLPTERKFVCSCERQEPDIEAHPDNSRVHDFDVDDVEDAGGNTLLQDFELHEEESLKASEHHGKDHQPQNNNNNNNNNGTLELLDIDDVLPPSDDDEPEVTRHPQNGFSRSSECYPPGKLPVSPPSPAQCRSIGIHTVDSTRVRVAKNWGRNDFSPVASSLNKGLNVTHPNTTTARATRQHTRDKWQHLREVKSRDHLTHFCRLADTLGGKKYAYCTTWLGHNQGSSPPIVRYAIRMRTGRPRVSDEIGGGPDDVDAAMNDVNHGLDLNHDDDDDDDDDVGGGFDDMDVHDAGALDGKTLGGATREGSPSPRAPATGGGPSAPTPAPRTLRSASKPAVTPLQVSEPWYILTTDQSDAGSA